MNVPAPAYGKTPLQVVDFYRESIRRIDALPGVNRTSFGMVIPWRDTGFGFQFSADGHVHTPGEDPRAEMRDISPGFFASLGVTILMGPHFNEGERKKASAPGLHLIATLAKL